MTTFTAVELAACLGRTKRAILLALRESPATELRPVRGQRAKAWEFSALPGPLQAEIRRLAADKGYQDGIALLADSGGPACAVTAAPPAALATPELFDDLADELKAGVPDPAQLTPQDRWYVWRRACRHYDALVSVTPEDCRGSLRPALVSFLVRTVPGIIRTGSQDRREALETAFRRALRVYKEVGIEAMRDNRSQASGNHRPILCSACWQIALAVDVKSGGNESLAWRLLKKRGALCPECADRHKLDLRKDKSYVPSSIRRALTPLAKAGKPWRKSEAAGRADGPHVRRDWSNERAGNRFVADDANPNHITWKLMPNGDLWVGVLEILHWSDELTNYRLGFRAICGHYSSIDIMCGELDVHDRHGLPHESMKYENGVWQARVLHPVRNPAYQRFLRDAQEQLERKYGITLTHFGRKDAAHFNPRTPTAKVIEGAFLVDQRMQQLWPGFVGFRQRDEKSDEEKRFEAAVKAGKAHPGERWLSVDDFVKKYSEMLAELNNEPQKGRLKGRTPLEVWSEHTNARPLRKLAPEDRWIISTDIDEKPVQPNGLTIRGRTFANGELGKLIGKRVLVLWHIDCPSLIHVQHPKTRELFPVPEALCKAHPETDAEKQQGRDAARNVRDFNRVGRAIADSIHHPVINQITQTRPSGPPGEEYGQQIEKDKQAHLEKKRRSENDASRVKRAAGRLGLEIARTMRNPDRVAQGLELEREALAELDQEGNQQL